MIQHRVGDDRSFARITAAFKDTIRNEVVLYAE